MAGGWGLWGIMSRPGVGKRPVVGVPDRKGPRTFASAPGHPSSGSVGLWSLSDLAGLKEVVYETGREGLLDREMIWEKIRCGAWTPGLGQIGPLLARPARTPLCPHLPGTFGCGLPWGLNAFPGPTRSSRAFCKAPPCLITQVRRVHGGQMGSHSWNGFRDMLAHPFYR